MGSDEQPAATDAPGIDPAVEEKLAMISATAGVAPWATDAVRKLLRPGEMPHKMVMCAGPGERGTLSGMLESAFGENTVLVATDTRVAWVNPEVESASGSVPLDELRKVGVSRLFWLGKGEITLHLSDGSEFALGLWEQHKSHAKALARIVSQLRKAG